MINITPQPPHPRECTPISIDSKAGWSGRIVGEENLLNLVGFEPRIVQLYLLRSNTDTHSRVLLNHHFINLLNPTGHVMHQQFNIQQLYALPTLYLCVLYLSENKQRLVSLTA